MDAQTVASKQAAQEKNEQTSLTAEYLRALRQELLKSDSPEARDAREAYRREL